MPQSLARILVHIIFSTKNRAPFLQDAVVRAELHSYMAQVLQTLDCPALIINGTEDHVHVLFSLSRQHAIKTIVEKMKADPSKWIKSKGPVYRHFYWQAGYGAFSVSESQAPKVRTYIANQAEHHHRQTFQEEFRAICQKHGIEWDERYVWD